MHYKINPLIAGFLILLIFGHPVYGQYVPTHISNNGIYEFLDELATLQIIELNTTLKPYSRKLVLEKLIEAKRQEEKLTTRQNKELLFYLKDYRKSIPYDRKDELDSDPKNSRNSFQTSSWAWINKPSNHRLNFFFYRDSSFHIAVNPILGVNVWSGDSGTFHHWWNGIETYASYKNFSLYASLRDNHESVMLTDRDFLNDRIGGANIKLLSSGQRDYDEMRGGMTYTWDFGHVGIMMDQFSWGDAYNGSNIFSGRTPAFARIEFQLNPTEWLQFNYLHGSLISEVVDSSLSFWSVNNYESNYREVYHPKYMAANFFTFKPFQQFYVAVGNSVIYDNRLPHIAFFIPPMFWKSIDHTLNAHIDNMNSMMFFSLSSKNIRGLHLYATSFIDELAVARIFRDGEYNFTSTKIGARSYQLPATNITLEYTWSNALVFQHYYPTTTFESNNYNLGHFLEDNARDIYAAIEIRPFRTFKLKGYYNKSKKGPDHTVLGTGNRITIAPLDPVVWESTKTGVIASMQLIHDLHLRFGYELRNVTGEAEWLNIWTPEFYHGKTGTLIFGVNYGW